jgi:GNAT superfamily N-acetyltransferase
MSLTIDRVRTRAELSEFITLPRRLYEGMPGYVTPLDHERRQLLDPAKAAFFNHGTACYWIARRDGTAVGRVSAQIDLAAVGPDARNIGLFGCLDAADDGEVVATLLRTAEDWLRERKRSVIRGPFLLSINGEPGLLVDGHEQPPVTLSGWHPPYLDQHVQAADYGMAARLFYYLLDMRRFSLDDSLERLGRLRAGTEIAIRPLRMNDLESEMEMGRRIFNEAWQHNWGFTPATEADVADLVKQFKPFIFPDFGFFVDFRGEPVAFVLSVPNVFEITADLGPRPSPAGWMRLLFRIWRQQYRNYRIVLLGITPKYQGSLIGALICAAAFEHIRKRVRARGVDDVVAGWILERNLAMRRPIESLGFRTTTTYKIYEKALEFGSCGEEAFQ